MASARFPYAAGIAAALLVAAAPHLRAQVTEAPADSIAPGPTFTVRAYADAYYARYNSDQGADVLQPFSTAGARDNNLGLNIAELGVSYAAPRIRANVVLHAGDIPRATWSSDFEMVQVANAGVRLADGLWLDAGFFRTHIGTESFLPKNNMLSQTAYVTYNEPFYQAGARLSLERFDGWTLEVWGLNGYNSFVDNNSAKSLGVLVSRELSDRTSVTYTSLLGRESPDGASAKQLRFYQNAYLDAERGPWTFQLGADLGLQTNTPDPTDPISGSGPPDGELAMLFAVLTTARYAFTDRYSVTARAEVFNDNRGFIAGTVSEDGGRTYGIELAALTLGAEYAPAEGAYLRVEGRYTRTTNGAGVFPTGNTLGRERVALLATLGVDIARVLPAR